MFDYRLPINFEDSINQSLQEYGYIAIKVGINDSVASCFPNNHTIQTILNNEAIGSIARFIGIKCKVYPYGTQDFDNDLRLSRGFYIYVNPYEFTIVDDKLQYLSADIYTTIGDRVIYDGGEYYFEIEEFIFVFATEDLGLERVTGNLKVEYPSSTLFNHALLTNIGILPSNTVSSYVPYFNKRDYNDIVADLRFCTNPSVENKIRSYVNNVEKEVWGIDDVDLTKQEYSSNGNNSFTRSNSPVKVWVNNHPVPYNPHPDTPDYIDVLFGITWECNTRFEVFNGHWESSTITNGYFYEALIRNISDEVRLLEFGVKLYPGSLNDDYYGLFGSPNYNNDNIDITLLAVYSDMGETEVEVNLSDFILGDDEYELYIWYKGETLDASIMSWKARFTKRQPITGGGYKTVEFDVVSPLIGGGYKTVEFEAVTPLIGGSYRTVEFEAVTPLIGGSYRTVEFEAITPASGGGYRTVEFNVVSPTIGGDYNTVEYEFEGEDPIIGGGYKTVEFDVVSPSGDDPTKPLTFKATANNSSVTLKQEGSPSGSFEYSLNGGSTWNSYTIGTIIPLNEGDEVCFKSATDRSVNQTYEDYVYFEMTGSIEAWHNVGSMLYASNYNSHIDISTMTYAFYCLFMECASLVKSPLLPATTLADSCYCGMFSGRISLTTCPVLPATTLADSCYEDMFSCCTSLTSGPVLPATTLAEYCYYGMFSGCTSLTSCPALPATTLAKCCYIEMFYGCTSLTSGPDLPATTLAEYCYCWMFEGCSNLSYIKCYATTAMSQNSSCTSWLVGVSATGDFYADPNASWESGSSGIPSGWTRHNITIS